MSKQTTLTVHVVLDRSGSMWDVADDTIGAFNAYVDQLEQDAPASRLSLTIFDSQSIDTIVDDKKIGDVAMLTRTNYQPRGGTPLYDAIGKTVTKLDTAKGKAKALIIITDGQENDSTEYTKAAVKKLLDDRQNNDGWLVLFLGADMDAFEEGGKIGTSGSTTLSYSKMATNSAFATAAAATARYTSAGGGKAGQLRATFTQDERDKAEGKP